MAAFAIIPAAGASRRMGQPKLLLPVAGRALIEHVLAAWRASRVSQIVAVVRESDEALQATCRQAGAHVVVPPGAPPEMKDSVAYALAEIESRYQPIATDVWLLAPADMPHISASVANKLLAAHAAGGGEILVPTFAGKRGHPVLFSWGLAAEVAFLAANEGVNALLRRHPVREIVCDEFRWPADMDTPADYRRLARPDEEPAG